MNIQMRDYQSTDKAAIAEATEKLHEYVVALDPIKRLRKMPGYVEHTTSELFETIEKQEGKIFVAEDDGKFIGFVAGFTMKQSEENLLSVIPSKLGVISDVYVDDAYRGQQLGTNLMEKMEAHLKDMGCDAIWIDIVAFNTTAHSFYNKLGYTDREIGLIKKI